MKAHREGKCRPRVGMEAWACGWHSGRGWGGRALSTRKRPWEARSGWERGRSPGPQLSGSLPGCFPHRHLCEKTQVKVALGLNAPRVHWGCHSKGHRTRWFPQREPLPHSAGATKSEMKVQAVLPPGRWRKVLPASSTSHSCRQSWGAPQLFAASRPPGPPSSHAVPLHVCISVLLGTPTILD